ncbi:MAG TPA: (2Fe-2S)-binding protein [Candidatus Binataceae bacterium]|jgi:aerobic-type carbon monoxide dehydrogenase small subunit (CoxS/CutS family)|nr:(2Fe-2S)-binding protein [Candidatus Binataceae bacterium]
MKTKRPNLPPRAHPAETGDHADGPNTPPHADNSGQPRSDAPGGRALSRRAFIKGAGVAAAIAGLGGTRLADADEKAATAPVEPGVVERLGPGAQAIELLVNGNKVRVAVEPRVTLVDALRNHLGLTGTKLVCDRGACGACTVHLDGRPVTACMIFAFEARGHTITTVEGLGSADRMHPVQSAFVANDALQCGFCTPGMVMSVAAEISRNPAATLDDIKRAVAGNICRCGTYPHVFRAALAAAGYKPGKPARGGV